MSLLYKYVMITAEERRRRNPKRKCGSPLRFGFEKKDKTE